MQIHLASQDAMVVLAAELVEQAAWSRLQEQEQQVKVLTAEQVQDMEHLTMDQPVAVVLVALDN
jgi:hypothetical protein